MRIYNNNNNDNNNNNTSNSNNTHSNNTNSAPAEVRSEAVVEREEALLARDLLQYILKHTTDTNIDDNKLSCFNHNVLTVIHVY